MRARSPSRFARGALSTRRGSSSRCSSCRSEFAFTLAGAVFISGIVALTLSPMMASRLLHAETQQGFFPRLVDRAFEAVKRTYARALAFTLRTRGAVYAAWVVLTLLIVPM